MTRLVGQPGVHTSGLPSRPFAAHHTLRVDRADLMRRPWYHLVACGRLGMAPRREAPCKSSYCLPDCAKQPAGLAFLPSLGGSRSFLTGRPFLPWQALTWTLVAGLRQ